VLKIVIILLFIISGLWWCQVETPDTTLFPLPSTYGKGLGVRWDLVISPAFAVALIFVSFSYSGWNAAAYLGGEIKDPGRNLPRALILGTTIVIILYLGLNFVFINTVPFSDLAGKVEVGSLAAQAIFGDKGGTFMELAISLILVSSVSAMIMTGPRIYQALGEDFSFYRILAVKTKRNAPLAAILLQMSIAILLIVTTTFESLLYFIGFTLSIITFLTVLGIYIHRHKYPNVKRPYRTLGYPVTPAIYLLLSIWMVVHTIIEKPVVSLAGFGTLLVGLGIYYLTVGKKNIT
ncbi:MAG: amino acid permease, partial [Bacteroidetes bacterium]|nr:amino acid permease [Bacteroidota bacterium]